MRKVICCPENLIPQQPEGDIKYFSTYSISGLPGVGYFGSTLIKDIKKAGLATSRTVWDFSTIALSVVAADKSLSRKSSPDGWTRQIDLTIYLCNHVIWEPIKKEFEKILRLLTGDFWFLNFKEGGVMPPRPKKINVSSCDCVSLLSGGVDSLVGAIDLVTDGYKPIFVSQTVRGDKHTQKHYANRIRPESQHFQWNPNVHPVKGESEGSTRGRSIIFFAFAALAASSIRQQQNKPVNIYVPENGFISLNIPLNSGRIGSFSTKTTHPVYLKGLQKIWEAVGINCKFIMPYQYRTKGELLAECNNQQLLKELVFNSVSCGKYRVYKMQHCGRCVPCLVRRAAFQRWGEIDSTNGGYYSEQLERIDHGNPDDIGAVANACLIANRSGLQRVFSGYLSFSEPHTREHFVGVFTRGLEELELLLKFKGVI